MLSNENTKWLNLSVNGAIREQIRHCGFLLASAILLFFVFVPVVVSAETGFFQGGRPDLSKLSTPAESADTGAAQKLTRGKFLVAARRLGDPNFRKTVVLLIRYGSNGAMGLVINRPTAVKLSTILPNIEELNQSTEPLYIGGPVEPTAVLLLVKTLKPPESATPVIDDVYLTSSTEALRQLIKKADKSERFRIFAGYAGWAPKQLESECDRGDWFVLEADLETLFDRKSAEIWPELIQRAAVKWVRFQSRDRAEVDGPIRPPTTGVTASVKDPR